MIISRANSTFISILSILFLLLLGSCKTQEEIQREQLVDSLSLQMVQGQKNSGENLVRLEELQTNIIKMKGDIEEKNHLANQNTTEQLKLMQDRMTLVEESNKSMQETLTKTQQQLAEQKTFLNKVLKTLEGAGKKGKARKSKKSSPYDLAMSLYRGRKYTKAKTKLIDLLNNKKIRGNKKARVYHNLGMIEFIKKRNEDALVYFSKLFTEHPKASYNANGLLFMAKAFKKLKRQEEYKQTLEELVKRYPKAKQVKEAKNLLKTTK